MSIFRAAYLFCLLILALTFFGLVMEMRRALDAIDKSLDQIEHTIERVEV